MPRGVMIFRLITIFHRLFTTQFSGVRYSQGFFWHSVRKIPGCTTLDPLENWVVSGVAEMVGISSIHYWSRPNHAHPNPIQ